ADEAAARAARSAAYEEAREAARARAVSFEATAPDLASGASGATAARAAGVDPVALPAGAPAPAALQPAGDARAAAPAAAPPAESVPLHVEWLVARGGGRARVRLHPPELGELQLTVTVRGQDVEVAIRAQEVAAGQAVLASREQLADGLASRDLRMEGFDVQWDEQEGVEREERNGRHDERPEQRGREHPGDAPPRPTPSRDDALPVHARTNAPSPSDPVNDRANDRVDLHV
nr:flagellar hook-length control protein FliK [Myxococcota bacterium]